jgi:glycosyltransferase involved in cell wall biosynthesis
MLDEFRARHGRVPRVLHIGNIANNAFLNAKLLNQAGFDCDVLCYDYYHVMGSPEWEDADFEGAIADQFRPDWAALNLNGYQRPSWFAQGPLDLCIDYLLAKRKGKIARAATHWEQLGWFNKTVGGEAAGSGSLHRLARTLRRSIGLLAPTVSRVRHTPHAPALTWGKLESWAHRGGNLRWLVVAAAAPVLMSAVLLLRIGTESPFSAPQWLDRFRQVFPDRPDPLLVQDLAPYASVVGRLKVLFNEYDIVQAYATDVVFPLLAGTRPYLGFEHGTLRTFTLADNAVSRLTALGYQQADHVFITNGDCLEYARKIKVTAYTPMVHPLDDTRIRSVSGDYARRHAEYGVKYLFLCPLRHDWAVKGTDKYIRALPLLASRIGRAFRVIMTQWGTQVDDSKRLAKALGVNDLIVWREPFNRGQLIREQKSCDVVFDQIALPHFGATAPQAIAAGVPVIMSYDPASTAWIIPEPAPILTAWTPDEIVEAVVTALDPEWRAGYEIAARKWFDTYHSGAQAVRLLSAAYRDACTKTGLL